MVVKFASIVTMVSTRCSICSKKTRKRQTSQHETGNDIREIFDEKTYMQESQISDEDGSSWHALARTTDEIFFRLFSLFMVVISAVMIFLKCFDF